MLGPVCAILELVSFMTPLIETISGIVDSIFSVVDALTFWRVSYEAIYIYSILSLMIERRP